MRKTRRSLYYTAFCLDEVLIFLAFIPGLTGQGFRQDDYKAALVDNENYLLHLSRYIHLNPVFEKAVAYSGSNPCKKPDEYPFSSYLNYLGKKKAVWLKTNLILSFFKTAQRTGLKDFLSYQSFVEDYLDDSAEILGNLILEA